MKKFLLLMFTLVCAFSLVACFGGGESASGSEDSAVESVEESVPAESEPTASDSQEIDSQESDSQVPVVTYTVTFRQSGEQDVVITVNAGEGISEENIPTPADVTGHTVSWDVTDFSAITGDLVVNAVAVANDYVIVYVVNGSTEEQSVTYGEEFTLKTLDGLRYWVIEGTEDVFEAGVYSIADNVRLVPVFDTETNPY